MTYEITTDAGNTFVYDSESDYLVAEDWYNDAARTKQDIMTFCAERGIELMGEDGMLVEDWADMAMHAYATSRR